MRIGDGDDGDEFDGDGRRPNITTIELQLVLVLVGAEVIFRTAIP